MEKYKATDRIVASIKPDNPLMKQLIRYLEENDYSMTSVVKKALKMYLDSEENKQK